MKLLNTNFNNMYNMFREIKYKMKKLSREPGPIKIKQTNVSNLKNTVADIKNSINDQMKSGMAGESGEGKMDTTAL